MPKQKNSNNKKKHSKLLAHKRNKKQFEKEARDKELKTLIRKIKDSKPEDASNEND